MAGSRPLTIFSQIGLKFIFSYYFEKYIQDSGIHEARRSADEIISPDALAQFLAENPKKEKELSAPVRKKLRQKPTYIVQVKPKAYIKKQTSEV